ncbi:hypothetical protein KC19_2G287900 [Ceratodon purpureus]|uniref:Uncharacterized protein n=1 Tax=Ceratodon purpureus TaxID=3225 RepID=A0A8T0J250_CERPU|nr:hypothetical protein KC19_2G287900 [Ceratodon purpureus]
MMSDYVIILFMPLLVIRKVLKLPQVMFSFAMNVDPEDETALFFLSEQWE